MSENRPSVFISFAHRDSWEFVKRLEFALCFYLDAFADWKLKSGEYPPQLFHKIETSDYFVFVMSPYSLGDDSWCRKEWQHAFAHKRDRIILVRQFPDCGASEFETELITNFTYGDFVEDFDRGFRRITEIMLREPRSSWEYLKKTPEQLLLYLNQGLIPGLISKSLAEWIIVDKLWVYVTEKLFSENDHYARIVRGAPRTPRGILWQTGKLIEYFARDANGSGAQLMVEVSKIASMYVSQIDQVADNNHEDIGKAVYEISRRTKSMLFENEVARGRGRESHAVYSYFDFDVVEKLAELLTTHSRRSRYLY
jgi:hypothetical protein